MQISRLFEIAYLLLDKKKITAKELALRFEVSERTIYRDVETLSAAGVPVYTDRGRGGGIGLLDEFVLNKSVLSVQERDNILFSLRTLQATRYPEAETLLKKLGALFQNSGEDWIQLDFTPWGSNPNAEDKLALVRNAVLKQRRLEFFYVSAQNRRMCKSSLLKKRKKLPLCMRKNSFKRAQLNMTYRCHVSPAILIL